MSPKRFSTFEGVFTPSLLSILGVIMYLRLGWVVGQVGLPGALGIIVFSNLITIATVLSMSSIVTNIRIGTGGAYSIISKSLGIEAGGAIGLPLYLSQAVSVAFYITGFTETWVSVFPGHNPQFISLGVWLALLIVSYISARLAFRLQYVIMAIVFFSLFSVFMGQAGSDPAGFLGPGMHRVSFWAAFAIFFPAVTGVLAGASMSGELLDPPNSIRKGTLAAVGVSLGIYISLALWLGLHVSSEDLVGNPSILIDLGRWKWLVVAGIMGATLSSALSMFVGSPRILMALGRHAIVPGSKSFMRPNAQGEPSAAILMTSLVALITLMVGTLNTVAAFLTMFFLITYGMINLSVFIEQSIGIASFRPSFRIPRLVSFLGALGCFGAMFLINWSLSLAALVVIVLVYLHLLQREVKFYSPDVRSGVLVFLAERLALAASRLPYHPKIWKPNLIVPVMDVELFVKAIPMIRSIGFSSGRLFFYRVIAEQGAEKKWLSWPRHERQPASDSCQQAQDQLAMILEPLKEDGLFVEQSVIVSTQTEPAFLTVLQAATDKSFPPNTLVHVLSEDNKGDVFVRALLKTGITRGLGIVVLKFYQEIGLSRQKAINLWIRRQSPNADLSILMSLQLMKNWEAQLRILQAVDHADERAEAEDYLQRLMAVMRLPTQIETQVMVGGFRTVLPQSPQADLNIFGMPAEPDLDMIREVSATVRTAVLFLRDSEHESAVA